MKHAPEVRPASIEVSDDALFASVAAGDLSALGSLFDRHAEAVRQFVLRASARDGDADDVVQETFLTAARAARNFDGRASALPFLLGIAAQTLRHRRRSFSRLRTMLSSFAGQPEPTTKGPDELLQEAQTSARVRDALGKLSEDRRMTLVLVEWNGLSGPEAAEVLGVPVGTVLAKAPRGA